MGTNSSRKPGEFLGIVEESAAVSRPSEYIPAAAFDYDVSLLPDVVADRIASFLDGLDLVSLGKTCRFWHEVANRNAVWKCLVERRFGSSFVAECEDFKKVYFKLANSKKKATSFCVVHLNGRYLAKKEDTTSYSGEIIVLKTVCWLQIDGYYEGVLPGTYELVWRMKVKDPYLSCNHIEFRAKPKDECGTEVVSKWKNEDFVAAQRRYGKDKWFLAKMGQFQVTSLCKVYVEIKGRIDYWCGGIAWDYAQLCPVRK